MLRCLWVQRGMCWQELQATRPKLWAMDQAQGRAGAEEGTRAKAALTRQLLSPETGRSQRARPTLPCGWALSPRSGGHWLLQGTRAEPSSLDTRHLTQGRHTVSPTIPGVTPSPCREQGGACPQQLQELLPVSPQPSFLSAGCLCPGTPTEKVEADHRSIYVGNVSRGSAKGLSVGALPAALGQEYRTPNGKANSEPRGPWGGGGRGRGAAPWRERGQAPSGRPPHGRWDSGFPRETPQGPVTGSESHC